MVQLQKMSTSGTSSPLPFSHAHRGTNITLSMTGLTARRTKSYNQALVVSSAPLEDNLLYQVEVKEVSERWKGYVKIGVSGLPPETMCDWSRWTAKSDTSGRTIVLDGTEDGRLCVWCKGEKTEFPGIRSCLDLTVGERLGVVCIPQSGVRFLVNGKIAARVPFEVPSPRRVIVDVYGRVTVVEVLPMSWRDAVALRIGGLPKEMGRGSVQCHYFELCRRFLAAQRCTIPDGYFNWSHCKCYCTDCYDPHTQPRTKCKGQPPEEYVIPTGWAKFAVWVPKRAEVLGVFREWHVCYHGLPVDSVAPVLECGQLMIRGDKTLPHHPPVPAPKNHFNETFKPDRYNLEQIFLSPSIHYCTHGEVYAGSQRCVDSGSGLTYTAKVAFQLRIHPRACVISKQTTQKTDTRIDPCIPNDKLEWATEYRSSTILCALCVKLVEND